MRNFNQPESLGHLSGLSSRLFNRLLTSRFRQAGIELTAEQWGVLLTLRTQGTLSQRELTELLYLEKSSVSRSIQGLVQRAWLRQITDPQDSRKKLISLTEKAILIVEQCSVIAQSVLDDAQQGIEPDSLSQTRQQLSQVVANLRRLNQLGES